MNSNAIKNIRKESPPENVYDSLKSALKHLHSERLVHVIPMDVLNTMKKVIIAASPAPTIERNITFGGYTVQEYYDFWIGLSALMVAFLRACEMKYSRSRKQRINPRVLIVESSAIVQKIHELTDISLSSCENIVNELILDVGVRRPDIQVQPIVPIGAKDFVLVSPNLILYSNWEVCLLRRWAKSSDKYGKLIAPRKIKIAEQLANLVHEPSVKQAINKDLFDGEGDVVTDVDLGLFDSQNGYLVVTQLKWLIEPDSLQEESNAREELLKGIDQLKKCISLFNNDKARFMSNLFPQDKIGPEQVTDVQYILICRGFFGFSGDARQFDIDVLDYEIAFDSLKKTSGLPIRDRLRQIVDLQSRIEKDTKERLCYNSMKIAGYLFRTPGLKTQDNKDATHIHATTTSPRSKSPCPCGSGLQYQHCCSVIESLREADSPYDAPGDGSSNLMIGSDSSLFP